MVRVWIGSGAAAALVLAGLGSSMALSSAPTAIVEQAKVTDDTLKDRVEHRIETDATVRKYDIKVKVTGGDVLLTGTVATDAQKAEAARVAKVDGVGKVDNHIAVDKDADKTLTDRAKKGLRRTGETISDAWITTKVHWFFMGEDALEGSKIDVDTKDRVVTLNGTVRSEAGKARAAELAALTDGVTKVVNKLKIG
jgi:hyperosmotically inducible protein